MRTVKSGVESIKLLGKDHHIPIIRLRDEGDPFHPTEGLRLGQGDPHSISRVCAVGDDVLSLHQGDARVLHAKLFIGSERAVRAGVRKGCRSAVEGDPLGLRAKPMMDRPVRRWERKSMMYSFPCFTTAAL